MSCSKWVAPKLAVWCLKWWFKKLGMIFHHYTSKMAIGQNRMAVYRVMVYCHKPKEFGLPAFQTPCRSNPTTARPAFLKSTSLGLATIKSHVRIPVVLDLRPLKKQTWAICFSSLLDSIKVYWSAKDSHRNNQPLCHFQCETIQCHPNFQIFLPAWGSVRPLPIPRPFNGTLKPARASDHLVD